MVANTACEILVILKQAARERKRPRGGRQSGDVANN